MLIALEGIDGSGKTTIAKELKKIYKDDCWITAEPSTSSIGLELRKILKGETKVTKETIALLFAADRLLHCEEIKSRKEKLIITDRFTLSSIAYQTAQDLDEEWIRDLNKFALIPDLTVFLVMKPKNALARINAKDIFEKEEFLNKVFENYKDLVTINSKLYPNHYLIVDTNKELSVVINIICNKIRDLTCQ